MGRKKKPDPEALINECYADLDKMLKKIAERLAFTVKHFFCPSGNPHSKTWRPWIKDEMCGEAMMKIWEKLAAGKWVGTKPAEFMGWASVVAERRMIDVLRREGYWHPEDLIQYLLHNLLIQPADNQEDPLQVLHVPLVLGLADHQLRGPVERCQHLVHNAGGLLAFLYFDVVVVGEPKAKLGELLTV